MCDVTVSDAKSVLPWVALDQVTVPGTYSSIVDLGGVANEATLAVSATGSPTAGNVSLLGSLDGVHWYSVGVIQTTVGVPSAVYNSHVTTTELTDGEEVTSAQDKRNKPHFRYVRAYIHTDFNGTDVTASIAVGKVQ